MLDVLANILGFCIFGPLWLIISPKEKPVKYHLIMQEEADLIALHVIRSMSARTRIVVDGCAIPIPEYIEARVDQNRRDTAYARKVQK